MNLSVVIDLVSDDDSQEHSIKRKFTPDNTTDDNAPKSPKITEPNAQVIVRSIMQVKIPVNTPEVHSQEEEEEVPPLKIPSKAQAVTVTHQHSQEEQSSVSITELPKGFFHPHVVDLKEDQQIRQDILQREGDKNSKIVTVFRTQDLENNIHNGTITEDVFNDNTSYSSSSTTDTYDTAITETIFDGNTSYSSSSATDTYDTASNCSQKTMFSDMTVPGMTEPADSDEDFQ
jgi:hypothetical protein